MWPRSEHPKAHEGFHPSSNQTLPRTRTSRSRLTIIMTSSPPCPSPEVRECMNAPTPLPSASAIRDGEDTTSPLLSLSPELRDRIYHFVLIDAQRAGTTQAPMFSSSATDPHPTCTAPPTAHPTAIPGSGRTRASKYSAKHMRNSTATYGCSTLVTRIMCRRTSCPDLGLRMARSMLRRAKRHG
jgi:hypothetical protein